MQDVMTGSLLPGTSVGGPRQGSEGGGRAARQVGEGGALQQSQYKEVFRRRPARTHPRRVTNRGRLGAL